MKLNEAIARTLKDAGARTAFGLIGDANMFVVDSFVRSCGGEFVAAANEAGAVLMALGHASVSGGVAVATVTHGPGLANTLGALIEGAKARLPVVVVAGDTTSKNKFHLQKVPQRELVVATGAGFEQANTPESACADLVSAFRRAAAERRPVVFNLPVDFQWLEVEYRPARLPTYRRSCSAEDSPDLDEAIGAIASARRPVVLAGHGVVATGASGAVLRLARRIEAPVMTTLRAKDLFRGDPLDLGVMGTAGRPEAVDVAMAADCIVAFGASLNGLTTSAGTLVRDKRVVLVNDDPEEIGRHMMPDVAVLGDCGSVAARMVHWLDEAEIAPSRFCAQDEVRAALAAIVAARPPAASGVGPLDLGTVLRSIDAMIGEERILVTDAGRFMGEAWNAFRVTDPRLFVLGCSFGAIGMGLGHAIGASRARPSLPTVMVTGDGGFMLGGLTEFNTAVRHGLDIVVIVCNDGGYGSEHIQFRDRGMDPSISLLDWPDFAPVADALGGTGVTVRGYCDLAAVGEALERRKGPVLIDIKLDPDAMPRPPY